MSRREHITSQSYIDWLKSLGCLIYIPFTNDLQDKIGGTSCIPTGNSSYAFVNGYIEINVPTTYLRTCLNFTFEFSNLTSSDYTILGEAQAITVTSANQVCRPSLFGNTAVPSEYAPQYLGNFLPSGIPINKIVQVSARVYEYSYRRTTMYVSGELYGVWNNQNVNILTMASPYVHGFTFGCAGHNKFRGSSFRMRNFMFFNRTLTLSEIRQIQGYE